MVRTRPDRLAAPMPVGCGADAVGRLSRGRGRVDPFSRMDDFVKDVTMCSDRLREWFHNARAARIADDANTTNREALSGALRVASLQPQCDETSTAYATRDRSTDVRMTPARRHHDAVKSTSSPNRRPPRAEKTRKARPWGHTAPAVSTTVRSTECLPAKRSDDGCVTATRQLPPIHGTQPMPKRDGTPTRGEARELRRQQRNAQNSGLDYAQQRLRLGDANAAQVAQSKAVLRGAIQRVRTNHGAGDSNAPDRNNGSAANNANSGTPQDGSKVNTDKGLGVTQDRPSPPHTGDATRSADLSQTPTVSSQKSYLAPLRSSLSPPLGEIINQAGAGLKVEVPQVDDAGDVRWVMENLHTEGAEVGAPSRSALAMLLWARSDKNAAMAFIRDIFGKVFINRNAEEQERMERRRLGEIGEMIGRCLELRLRTESELREPVLPEVVGTGVV